MNKNFRQLILHVDLESGEVSKEEVKEASITNFLGGRGIGAEILWRYLDRNVNPLGKKNVLIFSTGPLQGTNAPTAGRSTILTKGVLSNFYLKTGVGGHFGAALRMAGYDHIVVHGSSNTPIYLWINRDRVELRDASHLWGKRVRETTRMLEAESKEPVEVACIGPGGENKVKFANIMISYYNSASRGGAGAVMGAKKLKAIVVSGWDGEVHVANPREFSEVVAYARERLYKDTLAKQLYEFGTAADIELFNKMHLLPSYNFRMAHVEGESVRTLGGRSWPEEGYLKRRRGCSGCPISCKRYTEINSGKYAGTYSGGPQLETVTRGGPDCGVLNIEAVLKYNEMCNDLGIDSASAASSIAWLMETYEKGLITSRDLGGLKPRWGDEEVLLKLTEMIAKRQGIGNLLAEETKVASEKIGGDSWKWAIQSKGMAPTGVSLRGAYSYALAFAVNPRGPDHLHTECLAELGATPEAVETVKKITGDEKYARPNLMDKRAEIVRWHEDIYAVTDALGICAFSTTAAYGIDEKICAELFQHATGIPMTPEKIMEAGRRIVTLERCFNVREGLTRKDDTLPWRIMNEYNNDLVGVEDPIVSQEKLDILLDQYYQLHEWDRRTGKPTKATLTKLGLEFVLDELRI